MEFNNYTGPFFIDITTEKAIAETEIANHLNDNSKRILHIHEAQTTWEINDLSAALKTVLLLQKQRLPFRLRGAGSTLFIEQME